MITNIEMPKYKSYKEVWALQIERREDNVLVFVDSRYQPRLVDPKIFTHYNPVRGDYFVVYKDGYESISPQKVFEEGYTIL